MLAAFQVVVSVTICFVDGIATGRPSRETMPTN